MKIVVKQLLDFIRLYPLWYWIVLLLFCSVSVCLNYSWGLQARIDRLQGADSFCAFFLLYAVHALFAYLLYSISSGNYSFWSQAPFLGLLMASFAIFAIRASVWQHALLIEYFSPEGRIRINRKVFNDVFRLLYLFIPLFLIWWTKDRKSMPFYGFSSRNHHSGLYVKLLLCMVPLIAGASMLSDFLDYYPRAGKLTLLNARTSDILLYEVFYGLDFTSIELFFRGFMVMAFVRYVGPHGILPMAVFYLSIHYGKPLGEAVSSFFGGSILGLIAFHSRSIYGGIMVHVGIAWLMEIGAFIGNLLRDKL